MKKDTEKAADKAEIVNPIEGMKMRMRIWMNRIFGRVCKKCAWHEFSSNGKCLCTNFPHRGNRPFKLGMRPGDTCGRFERAPGERHLSFDSVTCCAFCVLCLLSAMAYRSERNDYERERSGYQRLSDGSQKNVFLLVNCRARWNGSRLEIVREGEAEEELPKADSGAEKTNDLYHIWFEDSNGNLERYPVSTNVTMEVSN